MQQRQNWSEITNVIRAAFPDTEAIYRFGSWGTDAERIDSDLDIALLLPWQQAKDIALWDWATLNGEVAASADTDRVDLINLREADVLFQFEILRTGEVIYCADQAARLNFEVLTISKYEELNRWRRDFEDAALSGELYSARP